MGEEGPRQWAESVTEEEYVIENPATGERIRFYEEPTPGGGDVLRFEFWARPHIVGPAAHIHPKQEEYFEVREGVLSARVGKEDLTLRSGESVTIPPGHAPHLVEQRRRGTPRLRRTQTKHEHARRVRGAVRARPCWTN